MLQMLKIGITLIVVKHCDSDIFFFYIKCLGVMFGRLRVKWYDDIYRTVIEAVVPAEQQNEWLVRQWAMDINDTPNTTFTEVKIMARQQGVFRITIKKVQSTVGVPNEK